MAAIALAAARGRPRARRVETRVTMANDPAITTIFDGGRPTVRHLRKGKLVIASGPDAGKEFELTKPRVSGGRSIINDIPLTDKAVSGTHFEIVSEDDGYRLRDLNCTNGTFVGELRIKEVYLRPASPSGSATPSCASSRTQDVVEIALSPEGPLRPRDRLAACKMREIFATLEKVAPVGPDRA